MKKGLIIFLQAVVVLVGVGTLTFLLWEPRLEGRNVNATNFEIYFKDQFLAYAYAGSVAFFIALYQTFKLLRRLGQNEASSQRSVKAWRTIKYCALVLIAFVLGAEGYFNIVQRRAGEDVAGGVMTGLVMLLIFVAAAIVSAVFEQRLKNNKEERI